MNKSIAIIGAGISGITTAVLLQAYGFDVTIYTKEHLFSGTSNPKFASRFPSASIIPHSVSHRELNELFITSQSFFKKLLMSSFPGLTKHEHFELFAFDTEQPEYLSQMEDLKDFSNLDWCPSHSEIDTKSGWGYTCLFADWNFYFPHLIKKFTSQNGCIVQQDVDINRLSDLNEDIIINCTGIGSNQLHNENERPLILKGHLLRVKNTPDLKSPNGSTVSFNFSPGFNLYSDSNSTPLDVYCYPRKNDWILGGSRFKGTLDKNNQWIPDDPDSESFPNQIESLNSDIIKNTFDIDLQQFTEREHQYSYRYVRKEKNGLRIEKDEASKKPLIHNYAHGGAGVTLSWGCAFRCIQLVLAELVLSQVDCDDATERVSKAITSS